MEGITTTERREGTTASATRTRKVGKVTSTVAVLGCVMPV